MDGWTDDDDIVWVPIQIIYHPTVHVNVCSFFLNFIDYTFLFDFCGSLLLICIHIYA